MSRARDLADSADLNFDDGTLVIDSGNNRVGIGTASPSASLEVAGTTRISSASAMLQLEETDTTDSNYQIRVINGDLTFQTNNDAFNSASTKMTIDSSGDLHIGKTATNFAVTGATLKNDGTVQFTRDGGQVALFNRLTSDGTILDLRKDGSTVGSIGALSNDLTIGTGDTGLRFKDGSDEIWPVNTSTGVATNGAVDIGGPTERFKDLYLSGGVYLGGTGSANKLDDYEEGTWIPVYESASGTPSISYSHNVGFYTRIGNIVHVQFSIRTSSFTVGTASGAIYVGDLPFVVESTGNSGRSGGAVAFSADFNTNNPSALRAQNGNDYLLPFYRTSANGASTGLAVSDMATGTSNFLIGACTYQIDS